MRSGCLLGLWCDLQIPPAWSWLLNGRLVRNGCLVQNTSLELRPPSLSDRWIRNGCLLWGWKYSSPPAWSWLLSGRLVRNGRLVQNASLELRPRSLSDRWIHNGRLFLCDLQASPSGSVADPPGNGCLAQNTFLELRPCSLNGRWIHNGRLIQNTFLELWPCSLNGLWIHNGRLSLCGWRDICIGAWSRWRVGRLFRTNRSCPCTRPIVFDGRVGNGFLGAPCCLFGFLDNSCFWFLFVGWRWRWRRNGRLGTLPVSEELVVAPSCVGGRSWLSRICGRDNAGLRSLLVSVSRGYAGHL